jgi:pimeloyl-ACP methyl ester carboxylesterase
MSARRFLAAFVGLLAACTPSASHAGKTGTFEVSSKDGTTIAVECAGSGPELLIVHGGAGDRTRWTPMFAHLQQDFTVCAMDRRAHGQSGDGPDYSLLKEAEDVVAVVNARGGSVAVVGHSFGGVVAYEAAFLSPRIGMLVLYEPPLQVSDHSTVLARVESLIANGDREAAAVTFMRDIVQQSAEEVEAMRTRPAWKAMVASIEGSIRQDRALSANRWNPSRAAGLNAPTLLLVGSLTSSEELRRSIRDLAAAAPNVSVVTLEGQEHNAMDNDREKLANIIKDFLKAGR